MVSAGFLKWIVESFVLTTLLGTTLVGTVYAQNSVPQSAPTKPQRATSTPSSVDNWNSLTAQQKEALAPLSGVWANISPVKKQKWLDISKGFALLSAESKETLHLRMKEWVSLSPKQREQARINFEQTKKLTTDDKQTKWQAYQALSAEEKQKLASINAATKTVGAAPAVKHGPKDKLVTTPSHITSQALTPEAGNKTPKRAVINTQVNAPTTPAPVRSTATAPSNPAGKSADAP
ncbi:MAG: DUF3106 domain-containing protein [Burkholderiaceae bacterium]|nr:DUF3106 domain-containing protein [Burkholderiaceae bacterium]